jgi:hypothetical protein
MPTKMTLFFNQYQSGFSETYYHSVDDPATLAQTVNNPFYQSAAQFRHNSVILKAARFSRVGGVRSSYLIRPSPTAQGGRIYPLDPGPDVVSTTAVFLLSAANGIRRRVWVRGLADNDVHRDDFGNDILSPIMRQQTEAYFALLKTLGFQIRNVDRPPAAGLTWRQVSTVNHLFQTEPGRCDFVLKQELPAYTAGMQISFMGIPASLPHFPRTATIINATTRDGVNNYTIAYALPGGVSVAPKNMKVTSLSYSQASIYTSVFERFGEHKTGRPFGSLRGRSRAVSRSA